MVNDAVNLETVLAKHIGSVIDLAEKCNTYAPSSPKYLQDICMARGKKCLNAGGKNHVG